MTAKQQIATTIFNQLGGYNRVNIMVGLKDVFATDNGVIFKMKYAGAAANLVEIQLNGNDLYNVHISKIRGINRISVKSLVDVYADDLKGIIEKTCKVRLSL